MVRVLTAAAIVLLLASTTGLTAEEGYENLLDDPGGKTASQDAEITKEFRAAVKLLESAGRSTDAADKQKKFEAARIALEKVISMRPSSDLARRLRNGVKEQVITQVFLEAPTETLDKVKEFLRLAEEGRRDWLRDQGRIAELIKDVTKGQFDEMWVAIYKLKAAGQHAAPLLVEALKTGDRDARTKITMTLIASGPPVVVPLTEALKIEDDAVKQEIIFILGQIGDARALPGLAALVTTAKAATVRKDALQAVKKIAAAEVLKSAPAYYLDQAQAYYRKRFDVLQRADEDYIVWDWDAKGNKLTGRKVPEYAFYLEMAEKLCYEAIALNEHFDDAYSLLICVYYQQLHVCNNLLAAAEKAKDETLTQAEIAGIEARKSRIDEILRTAPALGKQRIYGALRLALAHGNVAVAVSCANALGRLGSTADLPVLPVGDKDDRPREIVAHADPLVAALYADNKQVRYNAAATLAGMADRTFDGVERIIPTLCDALGERGVRVALVADADGQVTNRLKGDLQADGYIVDTAHTVEGALNVAYAVPMKDVLIVDASSRKAIDTFLVDYRSRNVPIILLTTEENAEEAAAIYKEKVNGFLSKPVKRSELNSALLAAYRSVEEDTGKTLALSMNYMAAKALANVDVDTTVLPMHEAVPALVGALDLPDEVRLEAMQALTHIAPAGGEAQHALALVAANTGNSLEARLAALEALTASAIKHGGTTASVKDLAEKLLLDKEPAVRSAAARLIGAAAQSTIPVKRLIADARWVIDEQPENE